jgi:molybdopterin-guanine dinucleotide biosynthesis protein A
LEIPTDRTLATIADPEQYRGPLSGLLAALDSAAQLTTPLPQAPLPNTALLVTPLDMPLLTSDHLRLLVDCYEQAANPETVVTASFDGRRSEPLVAIYPLSATESLRRWQQGSSHSLSRWLEQHPHLVCQLPPAAAANVNTPQDAESLQP